MKIALIDDNKTVLMVNEVMLKKEGFTSSNDDVSKFTNIEEFYTDKKKEFTDNFEIIVCDYNLGENSMNGLEFFKCIISEGYKGTCVLLTGDDSITMKTKMLLHPNINYIIKNNEKNNNGTIFQLGQIILNQRS